MFSSLELSCDLRNWCHLRNLVIPAKAGIYSGNLRKRAVVEMDSRFRGNDRRLEVYTHPK